MVAYKITSTREELEQILNLQQKNLLKNLSEEEKKEQGFVTVEHTLGILQNMHDVQPHIIATHQNKVVGYALSMHQSFKNDIPVLVPMFDVIEKTVENSLNYIVMGQICIDKDYRGKGIFRGLYDKMKKEVFKNFDAIITEVDALNTRSSNAHKAIGFKELVKYESGGQLWELIIIETNS
ncbi:acetyltransferase (GNAT) family protein [Tenacibaculum adriaticum]|uniref:Acetyltransferase (GNAT) family protein n=1 Tax=Tenacibaculum adriaticum TaxID=413713 RepID=A0A5S5DY10_9FLAO|nr:GNAT family N-acetyltransferase [Tenacibaculum adriaticum]TYP99926.1 acetyltransferase (GNAT) family protein [Tenacibaculum adriaticum]